MNHPRIRRGRAVALPLVLCLFAAAAAAQKADEPPKPFEFYFKLYPEYKLQRYGTPSRAGTDVGTMGTLRNDTTVLSRDVARRSAQETRDWANSYVAVRGEAASGALRFGYDLQGLIDAEGSLRENFRTRDAFVYAEHPSFGRLAYGQIDTAYKEAGDVASMLGVASGNFVSTSRILSGVGWRAGGSASFHNRVNRSINWTSPRWADFNLALTHSVRPVVSAVPLRPTLSAAALQWQSDPWYAAVATEVHRDWLPLSLSDSAPAATSIRNDSATARSKDQAWRLSGGWEQGPWRVGADLARLRYSEHDSPELPGKFRRYANHTGQLSVEYRWNKQLRLAANHGRATAGSCALSGGLACSTRGLGGHQTSLGALYKVNDLVSVFALAAYWGNRPAATYGSSPQGADSYAFALGLKLQGF
jgi:predicted porin